MIKIVTDRTHCIQNVKNVLLGNIFLYEDGIIAGKKAAQLRPLLGAHGIWGIFVVSYLLWHGASFFFGLIQRTDPSYSFTMTSKRYWDPRYLTRIPMGSFKRKLYTSSQSSNKLRWRVSHCIAENDNFKTCPPKISHVSIHIRSLV